MMDNATRILILAAEGYTGLWDAVFEMNHEASPEAVAGEVLLHLLDAGLIHIFSSADPAVEAPVRASPRQAIAALAPGLQWVVPGEGMEGMLVYFAATDEGVARLHELHRGAGGSRVGNVGE